MTAFTETSRRTIKITGTLGELEGDLETEKLILRPFGQLFPVDFERGPGLRPNPLMMYCVSRKLEGTVIKLRAVVSEYQGVLQLIVSQIRPVREDDRCRSPCGCR